MGLVVGFSSADVCRKFVKDVGLATACRREAVRYSVRGFLSLLMFSVWTWYSDTKVDVQQGDVEQVSALGCLTSGDRV